MPGKNQIIEALQFAHFHDAGAINSTGDPAFTITFSFDAAAPANDFSGRTGWRAWTAVEKTALLDAFAHIETFLNVDFVEAGGGAAADLSLGMVSLPGSTAGLGGAGLGFANGDVTSYQAFATYDKTLDIAADTNLVLHELGHALGLSHTFGGVPLPAAQDNNHYSVMSYDADPFSGTYNDAMMLYDVLALQAIWGAAAYRTGDSRYTGSRTDNVDTIWDTGGTDILDASARANTVRLDLREGRFSTFGDYADVAIAYGVKIENATGGTGNDTLIGNALANILSGGSGADLLIGGNGRDTLRGKNGKDLLKGGSGNDKLLGDGGNDKLKGGYGGDRLEGGKGYDKIWGNGGADRFIFRDGADRDVIKDFEDDIDRLEIAGHGTLQEVLDAASQNKGNTYFRFDDGDVLVVIDMTLGALQDDLAVI